MSERINQFITFHVSKPEAYICVYMHIRVYIGIYIITGGSTPQINHCALGLGVGPQSAILAVHLAKNLTVWSCFALLGICNHFKAPKAMFKGIKVWKQSHHRRKTPKNTQKPTKDTSIHPQNTQKHIKNIPCRSATNSFANYARKFAFSMRVNEDEAERFCAWEPLKT